MSHLTTVLAATILTFSCTIAQAANTEEMVSDAVKKLANSLDAVPDEISTVAVYRIEPDSKGEVNTASLQDQIGQTLLDSGRFKVIDRKSLKSLLEEQKLSLTGAVDTRALVKAGKVIGVQGFFFGSVVSQADKVVLNLKLIDVQTSATIFAKKFVGESRSGAQLGIGWGYAASPPFGVGLRAWRGQASNPTELTTTALSDIKASTVMSWTLSYRQAFQALRWALLGIDLTMVNFTTADAELKVVEDPISFDGQDHAFGDNTATTISIFSLKPKLYLSSKSLFGWSHDWLNPYVGVGLNMVSFSCEVGGWGNWYGTENSYEEKDQSEQVVVVAPLFGTDLNLTKSLSIYLEGTYFASNVELPDVLGFYLADHNVDLTPCLEKGLLLNMGMKYSISIF